MTAAAVGAVKGVPYKGEPMDMGSRFRVKPAVTDGVSLLLNELYTAFVADMVLC